MVTNAEISFSINALKSFGSDNERIVFSPLSVMNVLGVIFAGSTDITAEEFIRIVFKGCNIDDILQHYFGITKYCKKIMENDDMGNGLKLILSNCLFLSNKPLQPSFIEIMTKYENGYRQLNFSDPENCSEIMNQFISQNTNGKIKNVFTKNEIESNTNLFILNALYFCGKWDNPFKTVYYNWFKSTPLSKRKVEMMYKVSEEDEKWNFTEGDNWICLGIPYKSRNSWLHVLLPTQKFGLAALLKEFNSDLLKKCITERNVKRIRVTLPVFQIENKVDFNDILKSFGLTQIFEGCGVKNIFNETHFVDKFMQLCNIDVNQYGTTAAAATVATMQLASKNIREEEHEFYADHPFAFFVTLVDNNIPDQVKSVLMMGIYN